jgi:hypothetical protein
MTSLGPEHQIQDLVLILGKEVGGQRHWGLGSW